MGALTKRLVKALRETADKLDAGTCSLTEDEALAIMDSLTHVSLSKEEACRHLNMSRSSFDEKVRLGLLPKGKKRAGFKELLWYRDDLDKAKAW